MKGVEERSGELVVSSGDGPANLEMTDHSLDSVALAIDLLVPTNDGLPVRFWRDDLADAVGLQLCPDGIGVVALVR